MPIQEDGSLGVRHVEDAPTSHPWRWLATIIGAIVVCIVLVATASTLMNGVLNG
jgi:hypothetical protein